MLPPWKQNLVKKGNRQGFPHCGRVFCKKEPEGISRYGSLMPEIDIKVVVLVLGIKGKLILEQAVVRTG